jgi:hypothetical protein
VPKAPELTRICSPADEERLRPEEKDFVTLLKNRQFYGEYRFGLPYGSISGSGKPFNDATTIEEAPVTVDWPRQVEVRIGTKNNAKYVMAIRIKFSRYEISNGNTKDWDKENDKNILIIETGDRINNVNIILVNVDIESSVAKIELSTVKGKKMSWGESLGSSWETDMPAKFGGGLKGFWGRTSERGFERLGPVWAC